MVLCGEDSELRRFMLDSSFPADGTWLFSSLEDAQVRVHYHSISELASPCSVWTLLLEHAVASRIVPLGVGLGTQAKRCLLRGAQGSKEAAIALGKELVLLEEKTPAICVWDDLEMPQAMQDQWKVEERSLEWILQRHYHRHIRNAWVRLVYKGGIQKCAAKLIGILRGSAEVHHKIVLVRALQRMFPDPKTVHELACTSSMEYGEEECSGTLLCASTLALLLKDAFVLTPDWVQMTGTCLGPLLRLHDAAMEAMLLDPWIALLFPQVTQARWRDSHPPSPSSLVMLYKALHQERAALAVGDAVREVAFGRIPSWDANVEDVFRVVVDLPLCTSIVPAIQAAAWIVGLMSVHNRSFLKKVMTWRSDVDQEIPRVIIEMMQRVEHMHSSTEDRSEAVAAIVRAALDVARGAKQSGVEASAMVLHVAQCCVNLLPTLSILSKRLLGPGLHPPPIELPSFRNCATTRVCVEILQGIVGAGEEPLLTETRSALLKTQVPFWGLLERVLLGGVVVLPPQELGALIQKLAGMVESSNEAERQLQEEALVLGRDVRSTGPPLEHYVRVLVQIGHANVAHPCVVRAVHRALGVLAYTRPALAALLRGDPLSVVVPYIVASQRHDVDTVVNALTLLVVMGEQVVQELGGASGGAKEWLMGAVQRHAVIRLLLQACVPSKEWNILQLCLECLVVLLPMNGVLLRQALDPHQGKKWGIQPKRRNTQVFWPFSIICWKINSVH